MSFVLIDFAVPGIAIDKLHALGEDVVMNMTDNPNFPDAGVVVVDAKTALDVSKKASAEAKTGSQGQKLAAKKAKGTLQVALKAVAKHVNYATTDRIILLSTGFNLNKESRSVVVLSPITSIFAEAGSIAGTVDASFARPEGMLGGGFEWCAGKNADTPWIVVPTGNRCSAVLEGFEPGTTITVRGFAIGSRDQKGYSQTIILSVGYGRAAKRA